MPAKLKELERERGGEWESGRGGKFSIPYYQFPITYYQFLTVNCQLSTVNCQLSRIFADNLVF
ncbi:MAG: hypothetical protein HC849_09315 [Oscillatoriales cyanobacterium RU_3_3]|nr:hypothetical protein [Microcoleus sp. SM1_3_4]NJM60340.1 hypothetical protein [Oscillatoriales cyanobacterium RU_3_3]